MVGRLRHPDVDGIIGHNTAARDAVDHPAVAAGHGLHGAVDDVPRLVRVLRHKYLALKPSCAPLPKPLRR